jgi:uncharacterized membrane protein HdeD (DUF308 family)
VTGLHERFDRRSRGTRETIATKETFMSIATTGTGTARSLRTLYFVRFAFSVIWVVLVFALAASATAGSVPGAAAGILLVVYPVWDAVATVVDIRASGAGGSKAPQLINIAFGVVAAVLMVILLPVGLAPAIAVFGAWASLSGIVQLILAIRRRRALGGQWPMIISGALSTVAGIVFIVTSSAPATGLTTLAGYSAFGAFWYLVGAVWLTVRSRSRRD